VHTVRARQLRRRRRHGADFLNLAVAFFSYFVIEAKGIARNSKAAHRASHSGGISMLLRNMATLGNI